MNIFDRSHEYIRYGLFSAILTLVSPIVFAEVNTEELNKSVGKSFNSILQMFDGSQIGSRYLYTETKGVETGNEAQWRARLNFTYALSKDEKNQTQWVLRGIGASGNNFDGGWNNGAGVSKGAAIKDPNSDFFLKNIWIEYNWDQGTAQFGSLETVPRGFSSGIASLESNGWVKGARYIGKQMEVFGLKVARVTVTAGRSADFAKPMATDGWDAPNYYDITVEAIPMDKLKVSLSNSIFTGMKSEDVIDYSPRIYAEYNTAELFKDVIDSISVDSRFHTRGNYPVQRFGVALNKKIKTGPAKDWSAQIAYVDAFTDEMDVPINAFYAPNKYGQKQGRQVSVTVESAPLAKPFEGNSELRLFTKFRGGVGGADKSAEDNVRVEFGFTLTEVAQKNNPSHLLDNVEKDIKRSEQVAKEELDRILETERNVLDHVQKAAEHIGN